jgi:SAM-dependent methyltransferase
VTRTLEPVCEQLDVTFLAAGDAVAVMGDQDPHVGLGSRNALRGNTPSVTDSLVFPKYDRGAYHWGKLAGRSPRAYHARLWARYGWFVHSLERTSGTIVDLGAGDGALIGLLIRGDRCVRGIEPDARAVEIATRLLGGRATVVIGTAEHLPFATGEVAAVTMCEVIEHLQTPDCVLGEVRRVLEPGGTLLISTPRRHQSLTDQLHEREYDEVELVEMLRAAGFHEVVVERTEPAWLVRLYATRPGRVVLNILALHVRNPFSWSGVRWARQLYARAR